MRIPVYFRGIGRYYFKQGWDYLQVNTQADEIQSSIKYTILYGYQVSSVKLNTRSDEKEGTFSVIHEYDRKINVEVNTG